MEKYHRLTVISDKFLKPYKKGHESFVRCECDCGIEIEAHYYRLRTGKIKSCGCLLTDILTLRNKSKIQSTLVGQIINNIKFLQKTNKKTKDRNIIYKCQCYCGKEFEAEGRQVKRGRIKSCGCSRIKDLTNQKFGKLLIIKMSKNRKKNKHLWECLCECGKIVFLTVSQIQHPNRVSCGCDKSKIIAACKARSGSKHHWYNHTLSDEDRKNRTSEELFSFRKQVFMRDNYTCKKCNQRGGNLVAHHLDGYHWCKEKRSDPSNGITLCKNCHNQFHKYFGKKFNTSTQFQEFING